MAPKEAELTEPTPEVDWLEKLPPEPSSLEITLRFRSDATPAVSEADVIALFGATETSRDFFKMEYFDVASAPEQSWRRRSEFKDIARTKLKKTRLDSKRRQPGSPLPRPTCEEGWAVVEDIDATRKADGTMGIAFSTGCETKSNAILPAPSGAARVCSATMERITLTTTRFDDRNGVLRVESWTIGDQKIIEVSAQAEDVAGRQSARRTFDAAAAALLAKGVTPLDASKAELTRHNGTCVAVP